MLRQAYSLVEIKSLNEETRTFSGTATTPTPDGVGDIVEPLGVKFANPLPLLLFHDAERPVGHAVFKTPTKKGIDFDASIPIISEPGTLKDRVDEAWQSVKAGLIRGVSIRIKAHKDDVAYFANGGIHWIKSVVTELSLVTIPQNTEATIASVKSCDTGLAATGTGAGDRTHTPGGTGTLRVVKMRTETTDTMKTIQEQIVGFESTKQAKLARMNEIMNASAEKGETLDVQQAEEHDTLKGEVESIDRHLERLKAHEKLSVTAAKAVDGTTQASAAASRANTVITVKSNTPPGIAFARVAMCIAASKGSRADAMELAKQAYVDDPRILESIKGAIGAGTTASGGGPIVQYTDIANEFIEYLRPGTIIGKFGQNGIPALRRVPFNSRFSTQTSGGSGYWVGQGKPIPLTAGVFGTATLDFNKVATIAVLTKEEIRFSNPSAEAKVRDDLAAALAARMDIDFVDPANAGTANVKPASVTNGVVAVTPSGTDADAVRVDFKNLMAGFISANITPTNGVLIMSSTIALNLSLMLNALGQREFPDISMTGGRLFGLPVIVSEHLTSYGSPSTQMIVAVNASDVFLADDGNVMIEASGEASLEMLDSSLVQDGTAGTGTSLVSLWQSGLLGLKAEREITWKKRRTAAAQYASPVAYTPST